MMTSTRRVGTDKQTAKSLWTQDKPQTSLFLALQFKSLLLWVLPACDPGHPGKSEQPVRRERFAKLGLACCFKWRHWQAELARVAAQEFHRRFDGNGIGSQAEQIAAQREQLLVALLCF